MKAFFPNESGVFGFVLSILVLGLFFASPVFGQGTVISADELWSPVSEPAISEGGRRVIRPEQYVVVKLNTDALRARLGSAPLEFSNAARMLNVELSIPKPDGTLTRLRLERSPVLSSEIADKFPDWSTFHGYGIDDPTITGRFSWTDDGFRGYVLSNKGTYSIDPYQMGDRETYQVFFKDRFQRDRSKFHCEVEEMLSGRFSENDPLETRIGGAPEFAHGTQVRTYRLAIATTFEYTNFFRQTGDTDLQAQTRALAQVVISINRIIAIYRKELAVSFVLVSGINTVFPVNPEVPSNYNNNGSSGDLTANQSNLSTIIGNDNFDVGHVFQTGDGGIATLSSVCGSSKARGLSGLPDPTDDPFDVDYVAHELGHQFAMNHTFNSTANCGSSPAAARKEPGSGVTIMGYAGICSSVSNVQRNSIDIFHVHNLTESINFLTTGGGSTCGILSGTNSVPVLSTLSDYTIPFNTPFNLTASATDADGDTLTYNWEQNSSSASTSGYPNTTDDDDISLISRPGFRSYLPTNEPTRTFPSLPYILNNSNEAPVTFTALSGTGSICFSNCITGEDLPSAARALNFRVSVRDARGGIADAGNVINFVDTTTPFKVTTQNSSPVLWTGGSNRTVTWDVSGTTANGINAANVKISLSTDGGLTFPFILAESTLNDGSANIIIPGVSTTKARIKIEAVGNIFFDINDVNFSIDNGSSSAPFDFDGDGKTDIAIFRPAPSGGEWWWQRSSNNQVPATPFGLATDSIAPGDFTGDGKLDITVWRPESGFWYILRSEDFSFYGFPFGALADVPMTADYDGDGKDDPAVFRAAAGLWFITRSSDNQIETVQFGLPGDVPVAADYDGDGKADIAIFRRGGLNGAEWWINRTTQGVIALIFGASTDRAVPGDYTGDGKADVAIFRPSNGNWLVLRSEDFSFFGFPFGQNGDQPVSGDYDGDGRIDPAVFRPSTNTWFISGSTSGTQIQNFGIAGDRPIPNAFVR